MEYLYCPNCRTELIEKKLDGILRKKCPQCEFIYYRNPTPAAGVILENDGKILLVKRKYEPKSGHWSLPAGFIEYEEDARETAVRETKEETGLDIKIKELLNVYGSCDDPRSRVVLVIYVASLLGGNIKPGDDAMDAKYFSVEKLPANIAFSSHRSAIEHYLNLKRGKK